MGLAPRRDHPGFAFLKFLFCGHCFLGRWASVVGGRCGGREEEISFSLPGLKSMVAQARGHSQLNLNFLSTNGILIPLLSSGGSQWADPMRKQYADSS